MQLKEIVTDKNGREVVERGTPLFPISVHDNDMSAFASRFVPWHWHDECEIVRVAEGEMVLESPALKTGLKAGMGAFINTGVLHSMRPASGSSCRMTTIAFDPALVSGAPSSIFHVKYVHPLLRNESFSVCIMDGEENWSREALHLVGQIEQMHTDQAFGYEMMVRSLLSSLWLLFLKNAGDECEESLPSDPYIKDVLTYIHANFDKELTLESIAASAGISCRTCSRSFRRQLQMSVFEYVQEYRLDVAAEQLAITDKTVTEISLSCGFSDPGYFARKFHERTGLSPRDFRRKSRSAAL